VFFSLIALPLIALQLIVLQNVEKARALTFAHQTQSGGRVSIVGAIRRGCSSAFGHIH
jgi:hypothetical protein